jgi:hypothetical protein
MTDQIRPARIFRPRQNERITPHRRSEGDQEFRQKFARAAEEREGGGDEDHDATPTERARHERLPPPLPDEQPGLGENLDVST